MTFRFWTIIEILFALFFRNQQVFVFVLQVIFIQIAVPSRTDVKEYQELKEEMDQVIGRINGRFSTANWSPIRYIYGCVSQVIWT